MPWYENRSGDSLWYEDRGEGCPVVLLHGWCLSSAVWKYQFDGLSAAFRIIAPDLRGHGHSKKVIDSISFTTFANDLAGLLQRLNLSKVVVVGWSMGAQIALQAFTELSDRLAGMVLVSATPCFTSSKDFRFALTDKEVCGMRLKVERNSQRALDGFHTRLFAEDETKSHLVSSEILELLASISPPDTAAILEALESLAYADMRPLLRFLQVPTLILNGSHDRICLPQASEYLKEHIYGAEHFVFNGCGHAPFLTQSQVFNAELFRFIRSVHE